MPVRHVYADANIFLDFFRFSKDDLGQLEKLLGHMSDGAIVLYLPQMTAEEFERNRDRELSRQIDAIKSVQLTVPIPICLRDSEKSTALSKALSDAKKARGELLKEAEWAASNRWLDADKLIEKIFAYARKIPTDPIILSNARLRAELGNPPGKENSLGDRINWEALLQAVPNNNDLTLITRDGDFITPFARPTVNMFLEREWRSTKNGEISPFANIKSFASNFDRDIKFATLGSSEASEELSGEEYGIYSSGKEAVKMLYGAHDVEWARNAIEGLVHYRTFLSTGDIEDVMYACLHVEAVSEALSDKETMRTLSRVIAQREDNQSELAVQFDNTIEQIKRRSR